MVRNWVFLACIWLVCCSSQGLGEKRLDTLHALNIHGRKPDPNHNGHLLFRGHQLLTLHQSNVQKGRQKIIFTCTRMEACGGLGDRFKGFVSTFILAVLLHAEFAVAWDAPSPIGHFYNISATVISESDLPSCRNHTNWSWLNGHSDLERLKVLRNKDFAREYNSSDCVTVHLNGAVWNHFILNDHFSVVAGSYKLPFFSKREVFQLVMNIFFVQPMPDVLASVQQIHASMHGKFRIGVQMRFGGLWGDPQRYEGSSVEALVACYAEQTIAMCLRMGSTSDCSVFITSDNPAGTALLTDNLAIHGLHVYPSTGESVHIDERASMPGLSNHIKTYVDWETLRSMDKLVCSRSGFGETASWAGNVPSAILKSDLCCFTDEGVEVPEGADPHFPERLLIC